MDDLVEAQFCFNINNEYETCRLAAQLATCASKGQIIALTGELGVGKTAFARAYVQKLIGKKEEVISPTFTLVQIYETASFPIYHFDFYRINDPEEVGELGFEEAVETGLVLIEWPSRLGNLLPTKRLDIVIKQGHLSHSRKVEISVHEYWYDKIFETLN